MVAAAILNFEEMYQIWSKYLLVSEIDAVLVSTFI